MSLWERARLRVFLRVPRWAKRLAMWRLIDEAAVRNRQAEVMSEVYANLELFDAHDRLRAVLGQPFERVIDLRAVWREVWLRRRHQDSDG